MGSTWAPDEEKHKNMSEIDLEGTEHKTLLYLGTKLIKQKLRRM